MRRKPMTAAEMVHRIIWSGGSIYIHPAEDHNIHLVVHFDKAVPLDIEKYGRFDGALRSAYKVAVVMDLITA